VRRTAFSLLLASLLVGVISVPAGAGVGDNPNVIEASDASCDNGLTSEVLLIVRRTGHSPDDGLIGVATSVHILNAAGEIVLTVFDVPGTGLDQVTTWCEWFVDGTRFGGDILLRGDLR
jgi:hypothetical protein